MSFIFHNFIALEKDTVMGSNAKGYGFEMTAVLAGSQTDYLIVLDKQKQETTKRFVITINIWITT